MLSQQLALAMQRILASTETRFDLTAVRARLVEEGLGTKKGKSVYFKDSDRAEMRSWLMAKGYSIEPVDVTGLGRVETLAHTPHEKAGGTLLKQGRVSVKALGGLPLVLGDEEVRLPPGSHVDINWQRLAGHMKHNCILVVENYENFDRIHENRFDLLAEFECPLVLYHGDPTESRLDSVMRFLEHVRLPVFAYMDADPAGIAMASHLPGLAGVIAPDRSTMEAQLESPKTRRIDLYQNQYAQFGNGLYQLLEEHPCTALWRLIDQHRAGVVQERWIGQEAACVVWR